MTSGEASPLAFVVVGHVDHGKSTLVGRLLADTEALPDGALERVRRICEEQHKAFEYAFLLDALEEEQVQGVTIDVTRVRFVWGARRYVIIDAPGHREFIRNMITGAAHADAAILLVDAQEGVQEQSRRHAYLVSFLGVRSLVVVVNKMDLVGYSATRFADLGEEFRRLLATMGLTPTAVVPASAREGDNLLERSSRMPWYTGPTVLEALAAVPAPQAPAAAALRLPVQTVLKFDERRIIAGRVESGTLAVGDAIAVWPSGHTAHVKSIETWPETTTAPERAEAGRSVGITLDDQLFLQRGDVITHRASPPTIATVVSANVFWLGRQPLEPGQQYRLRMTTLERDVSVFAVNRVMSAAPMEILEGKGSIPRNDVGEVILRATRPVVFDPAATAPATGRFVLLDGYDIVGGGIVLEDEELYRRPYGPDLPRSEQIAFVPAVITAEERALAYGHRSHVVWLTGMPGVGKSTLARYLERRFFGRGVKTVVLDGEHLRLGLSADLRFTDADRAEQARRAAEVAHLFQRAGLVVIVALVSPFRADREYARRVIGAEDFTLVYLHAPLGVMRERERHGLYAAAGRDDEVKIPGVNAPYEPPAEGTLVFDTSTAPLPTIGEAVIAAVERQIR